MPDPDSSDEEEDKIAQVIMKEEKEHMAKPEELVRPCANAYRSR